MVNRSHAFLKLFGAHLAVPHGQREHLVVELLADSLHLNLLKRFKILDYGNIDVELFIHS